jgi:hypothetical protein
MLASLFRSERAFRITLCLSLVSAVVPAVLCLLQLSYIRREVVSIERSVIEARRANDLVDRIGRSLFNFTAAALDLSEDEKRTVFEETDQHLHGLASSVAAAQTMTQNLLSAGEHLRLSDAISSMTHSWEEVVGRSAEGTTGPERAYHFLKVFDDAQVPREILIKLEKSAAATTEKGIFASLARTNEVGFFLLIALALGACVSTAALIGNYRFAQGTRKPTSN